MKRMKNIMSLLLTITMILGMTLTTMAQTVDTYKGGSGSITIGNANDGETYTVYKIFDVTYEKFEETDEDGETKTSYSVSYTTTAEIAKNMEEINDCPFVFTSNDGEKYYVTIGDNCNVDDVVKFIEKYIEEYKVSCYYEYGYDSDEDDEGDEGCLVLKGVDYGYYYITTTTGTLVTVDTITPDVTVSDKNTAPADKKTVSEEENGEYNEESSATVGDTVYFNVTITVGKGAYNYVLHDTMSDGLSFDGGVVVTVDEENIDGTCYTLYKKGEENDNKDEVINDGCTFEIVFDNEWLATLEEGSVIEITYSATVTDDAVEYDKVTNEEYVSYGDSSKSAGDNTTTYLYSFGIKKVNSSDKTLSGAEFVLYTSYDEENGEYGEKLYFEYDDESETYNVVENDGSDESIESTISAGNITIDGLGAGTYYLVEIKAPNGYNLLSDAVVIVIKEGENGKYTITVNGEEQDVEEKIKIENESGSELPSTGGMGTTILYILGIVLILGAGVVLVVRRRTNA